MTRLAVVLIAATLAALTACDPLVSLDLTVRVPPELTVDIAPDRPAEIVVDTDAVEGFGPGGWFAWDVAIAAICEPAHKVKEYPYHFSYIGCAMPTEVVVWLVPVPEERLDEVLCGGHHWEAGALGEPSEDDPTGEGTIFESYTGRGCESASEALEITLAAPGDPS